VSDHGGPASDHGDPRGDHGASAERTRLAWRRTGLSATAVGLLAARPALDPDAGLAFVLLAATAMIAWAALIGLGYRRMHGLAREPPQPGRHAVVVYTVITVGFAVIGGLVVTL
jgi:uncharacterized membrane protein YidH (DUF202 family)